APVPRSIRSTFASSAFASWMSRSWSASGMITSGPRASFSGLAMPAMGLVLMTPWAFDQLNARHRMEMAVLLVVVFQGTSLRLPLPLYLLGELQGGRAVLQLQRAVVPGDARRHQAAVLVAVRLADVHQVGVAVCRGQVHRPVRLVLGAGGEQVLLAS